MKFGGKKKERKKKKMMCKQKRDEIYLNCNEREKTCVTLHSIESRRHKKYECEREKGREKEKGRRYHNGFKGRRATSLLLLILLGGII